MIKVMYLQLNIYMYNEPHASSEAALTTGWIISTGTISAAAEVST
jgi:hypothetical protein